MENTPAINMTGFVGPAIMLLFALGFVWVWLVDRRQLNSAILAAACAFLSVGMTLQLLEWPAGPGPNVLFSGFFYTLAVLLTSDGMLRRAGKRLSLLAGIGLMIVIMAPLWYFSYVEPSLLMRIYVQNFGYGAILLVNALRLRPAKGASAADRVLFWVLLVFAIHFFPRTLFTTGPAIAHDGIAPDGSLFWQTLQLSLSVLGAMLALAVLATILTDMMEDLRRDRDRDGLTGILNRRGFEERANRLVNSRRRAAMSLIVCDLDHFKLLNDTYGHSAGDAALKVFGAMLLETARSTDIVGRIGGEEFALLLPNTDLAGARDMAERLRQNLAADDFPLTQKGIDLSASFGVAEKAPQDTLGTLFKRADGYLYEAKNDGRDRTVAREVSAASPPPAGDSQSGQTGSQTHNG
ncbi:GGDEF domain-containing protein [Nitratireductor sp.]|uniref:GGDEF domain-containing protein n=1 Tax=Nitratireductor sp. TaxID=1872084 RepID=UPI002614D84C|nr:GGDEF domain-containing protein [Nitratireductor sp.]